MHLSYNWLKKYIDLGLSPEELVNKLNISGLPVEHVQEIKSGVSGVVVARILKIEKHPNANKLKYCDVTDGKEVLKVVCGAPNIEENDIVPLAKIGATLPGGITIKQTAIRGLDSFGMMCSAKELGLGADHSGILKLNPAENRLGSAYDPVTPDTIITLEITPNRADLLCVTGVARFIAGILDKKLLMPSCEIPQDKVDKALDINKKLTVTIKDPSRCPRYAARIIDGVTIKDSPRWLKEALQAAGVRPINNVVDVTNYVMFELNQPLHAFDYEKIKDSSIIVRTALPGEKIVALDGKIYEPKATDLMITDSTQPIAIAGVMGGEHFSVNQSTKTVVLESAFFTPGTVRRTSRTLNVASDSSYRFERGIDISNTVNALNRAAALIIETAGGTASKNIIDNFPVKPEHKKIKVRFDRVNRVLGTTLTHARIAAIIKTLHFPVTAKSASGLTVEIPASRVDIKEEIDIIEDIAQINGYDSIPLTLPSSPTVMGREDSEGLFAKTVSAVMVSCGFSEAVNYSFLNNKLIKDLKAASFKPAGAVALKNPFNDEETHMKTTLVPDLIKNLITNYNNENENIHLFEIANVFSAQGASYTQSPRLCAISCGAVINEAFNKKGFSSDLYYIKSVAAALHAALHSGLPLSFSAARQVEELTPFLEYTSAVRIGDKEVGFVGQLKEEILYDNKLKEKAYILDLDLAACAALSGSKVKCSPIARFPAVKRDLSVIVADSVAAADVEAAIVTEVPGILKSVTLFDLYKGSQVPEGRKSLTYNILFQSPAGTLSEAEVNKHMERIILQLKNKLKAELRS